MSRLPPGRIAYVQVPMTPGGERRTGDGDRREKALFAAALASVEGSLQDMARTAAAWQLPALVTVVSAWGLQAGSDGAADTTTESVPIAALHQALQTAMRRAACEIRWLPAAGPTDAEHRMCQALRERTSPLWLVLDAHAFCLLARGRGYPPVPDVVRLVRQTGVMMLAVGEERSQRHRPPRQNRFCSWAEKGGFSPVFCDLSSIAVAKECTRSTRPHA